MAKGEEETLVKQIVYVFNLSRIYWGRRTNRADRAVRRLRRLVARHTKADRVWISNDVNNYIWARSREKPPRRIKVLVKVYELKAEGEEAEEEKKKILEARVFLAPKKAKPGPVEIKEEEKKA